MNYQILQGDNRDTLKTIADNSIDAIVTDPPYGIDFLGKSWDANTGAVETYQECLRVLKPGGHILAFSAARTYHHLAVTLEAAGFEIRDQIMWIYSSGFPKSQDVGKSIERSEKKRGQTKKNITDIRPDYSQGCKSYCNVCNYAIDGKVNKVCKKEDCPFAESNRPADNEWAGWGTQLKPAHEPIALARKPIKLSIAKNCQAHGVGALNIDATRVPWGEDDDPEAYVAWMKKYPGSTGSSATFNNILSEAAGKTRIKDVDANVVTDRDLESRIAGRFPSNVIGEIAEPYQKYFYCPKVGRKERHIGFKDPGPQTARARDEDGNTLPYAEKVAGASPTMLAERLVDSPGNNHPTVKPIELMKYLIRLITPAGGTVLDPFNGSGSTGCAAVELGHPYIGCELDPAYVNIAKTRIEAWHEAANPTRFHQLFSTE